MSDLFHECGVAAIYHLDGPQTSPIIPGGDRNHASRLIPRLLLDIQNRGQLAAGMSSYSDERKQLLDTHKDVGTVTEVFHLNHQKVAKELLDKYNGKAAIGHVRYATCGKDDKSYAQPFERHHIEKPKWFSFGFNGQLANYRELKAEILENPDFYLARETDTETLMHLFSQDFSQYGSRDLVASMRRVGKRLDGAYNIVFLNAMGDMFVARDPLGLRPMCFAIEDNLFIAASESVALTNLGISEASIRNLLPGHMIAIQDGQAQIHEFAPSTKKAHCFFEWIYFANVASTLDEHSVYVTRKNLGDELADQEELEIDNDTIVVPVPDTAKAAASAMAYRLNVPCLEGLIRNRYVGRTFIESGDRADKARTKYTPLSEVLEGKKVLLVEDTIVRSTTMRALIDQIRVRGKAREIHVRVACPPIIAPCFYGIDMSTIKELYAPQFLVDGSLTREAEDQMARNLGADSLRYLPVDAIARSINMDGRDLCQACVNSSYPTEAGEKLYQIALTEAEDGTCDGVRAFDKPVVATRL